MIKIVDSKEGEGTTFRITLPLYQPLTYADLPDLPDGRQAADR